MIDLTSPIIPYKGTGIFNLYENYQEIKSRLKSIQANYVEEIWKDNDVDPPWIDIMIEKSIELVFAKEKLFKIVLEENFKGKLPNGIHVGMLIEDAKNIDLTLKFNDWDEIFESEQGYWLEDSIATKKIMNITIFIPALESEEFFKYNW